MLKKYQLHHQQEKKKHAINHSYWINSFYLFLSHLEGNTFSGALSAATALQQKNNLLRDATEKFQDDEVNIKREKQIKRENEIQNWKEKRKKVWVVDKREGERGG